MWFKNRILDKIALLLSARESFRARVFRAFVSFIVLVSSAFTFFSVYSQSREVEQNLLRKGELLAKLLASSSRTGVFAENRDSLRDAVEGVEAQEEVRALEICTVDNRQLIGEQKTPSRGRMPMALTREDQEIAAKLRDSSSWEVTRDQNTVNVYKPIIIEAATSMGEALYFDVGKNKKAEQVIGYVKISLDRKVIRKEVREVFLKNLLIGIIFVLLGTIVIYTILRRVTRPLVRLTEAVRLLGKGMSSEKIPVESRDEFGKLAEAFNAMTEDMRKREEEKLLIEEKLRRAEKMEAVGRLARGIAHDFNNILTTVEGSLFVLKRKLTESSSVMQYMEQIQKSLSKMRGLVERLLTFSKSQISRLSPIDINKGIRKLIPMLKNLAGDAVEVKTVLCDEPSVVLADPLQIDQVLMNLCTNARDAMPTGGLLTIKTDAVSIDKGYPGRSFFIKPGRFLRISVSDTGTGMDEKICGTIFEPFFTTKEPGRGTGLGLSIVFGIVEQHKGFIDFTTEAGKGTEFVIYFPLLLNDYEKPVIAAD
jgi:signal transduction histidine kinase